MFTITHKFPSLNDTIAAAKKHWAAYSRLKRENTDLVARYASSPSLVPRDSRVPFPFERVNIKLTFFERGHGHLRDWDNVTFAKKFILDGLVQAEIIRDDSPKYIESVSEKVIYLEDYGVKVEIEEAH